MTVRCWSGDCVVLVWLDEYMLLSENRDGLKYTTHTHTHLSSSISTGQWGSGGQHTMHVVVMSGL